jgi:hypothetical protein
MKYDSVYPTFRLARQARSRLGGKLRGNHLAAMPALWMRLDHWPRTSPQAGAHHNWIGIRRGRCRGCGKTFTFLPLLSLPYTNYSLLTRGQALRRRLVEHCSSEEAAPTLKDPNRVPDVTCPSRGLFVLGRVS